MLLPGRTTASSGDREGHLALGRSAAASAPKSQCHAGIGGAGGVLVGGRGGAGKGEQIVEKGRR